jgi:ATP-dependent Clp protease ATP-binding subunit ClpX
LFTGGSNPSVHICGFCAAKAVAETTPQPQHAPPERPSKEERLAFIPQPKALIAHLDQFVIGQDIAKRRIGVGVSNHFKRLVDWWDRDAPDPK